MRRPEFQPSKFPPPWWSTDGARRQCGSGQREPSPVAPWAVPDPHLKSRLRAPQPPKLVPCLRSFQFSGIVKFGVEIIESVLSRRPAKLLFKFEKRNFQSRLRDAEEA